MKVSFITPTFNNGVALQRALDSILAQDYGDVSVTVVDGGSTDGSLEVAEAYARSNPGRVTLLKGVGGGVYNALNAGLRAADGDIIGTLHGNDCLVGSSVVSRVVGELERHPEAGYVYGDVHFLSASGKTVRYYRGPSDVKSSLRRGVAPPHPSMFVRRKVIDRLGGYDTSYRVAGDFDLFVRLAFVAGVTGRYLPLDMVGMSVGGLSTRLYNRLITNNVEKMRALRRHGVSVHGLGVIRRYVSIFSSKR